jgi:predicted transglutaminase-like cysteine proteinase
MVKYPFLLYTILASCMFAFRAEAGHRAVQQSNAISRVAESSPTLAPFQHVRFCLRYPSECITNSTEPESIEWNDGAVELLKTVNESVNASITPEVKLYGADLHDGWTIAPLRGDCNDYAVTKRHQLLLSGLPARALRLSAVRTTAGMGHLVLVVATTKGDYVMDNLTDAIRLWKETDYQWLKIQSSADSKFWNGIRPANVDTALVDGRSFRMADR